jgi:hypothetical protein
LLACEARAECSKICYESTTGEGLSMVRCFVRQELLSR